MTMLLMPVMTMQLTLSTVMLLTFTQKLAPAKTIMRLPLHTALTF